MLKKSKLLSISNAIWTKKSSYEVDHQKSIAKRNAIIVGLSIFSALSFGAYRKNATELKQTNQENRTLSLEAAHFKKDADHLFFENVKLKHRASVAEGLINSIQPPMPTNRDGLGALDEEEATRREVEILKEDAKEMKKWDEACKTLGINQDALFRIQKDIMER